VKKLLAILLLFVYTAASSGTVMSAHFCMGELAGISIGEKQQEQCGYCGMEDAGCCHDLLQIVKIDDSQLVKASSVSFEYKFVTLNLSPNFLIDLQYDGDNNNLNSFSSAHFDGGPPIYIRNCVYRI
jgi:hypothetical protein